MHVSSSTSKVMKWASNMLLLGLIMLGIIMSMSSSNLFMVWFGLELNMFGVIPFMMLNSEQEQPTKSLSVGIYYFMVQVLGSLLFSWGSIIGSSSMLGVIGLLMKMGVSPFFWWVPSVLSRVDWVSMAVISSIQKIPSLLLVRLAFDLSFSLSVYLCLMGLSISIMGMNFSSDNLKLLFAWSSVGKISLLFLLLIIFLNLGVLYFMCYSISVIGVMIYILSTKENIMFSKKDSANSTNNYLMVSLFLLIFSGLPPLLGFISKVLLFSGISLSESDMMMKQISVLGKNNYMVEYPVYSVLGSWSLSMIISMILMFQVVAYMKAFMKIYSSSMLNLEGSGRSNKNSSKISVYLITLVLMSFIPLLMM